MLSMKYVFTKHTLKRMSERTIKKEWIENTIESPDYSVSKDHIIEANKKINNKMLKVVFVKKDNFIKIISVMWR